ncbi:MAG: discoidin domain-containing protein, partial [Phycisphaerae bacterium]|nr:discoidin domain-containing protein [Phycisphaerae bacterium]
AFEFFVNGTTSQVGGTTPVDDGEWHYVAGTFGNQTLRIYVDGVQEGEVQSTGGVDINPNDWPIMLGGESSSNGGQQFVGTLDEVAIFNRELTAEEIQDIYINGMPASGAASSPQPQDKTNDVIRDSMLSWKPGQYAATHNLYLGASSEEVTNATVPTASGLVESSYDPGRLELGETYYWRVDEVNSAPDFTVIPGEVWTFTVEPYAVMIPVDADKATASSVNKQNTPVMTVNGSGLDGDAHSANQEDMWLSAAVDVSPWLMYEFDNVQKLDRMLIWNSNSGSEPFIGWGIKDVNIVTSLDGVVWTGLTETTISKAPGLPAYNEPQVIDFGLIQAKYVKIEILSNWGGFLKQYGVSEVQFYGLPVYARTPAPEDQAVDVLPDAVATWRAGREAESHRVLVSQDVNALSEGLSATSNSNSLEMSALDLLLGETYYWQVVEVNDNMDPSEWAGDVWTLTTANRLVVDDFEGYTNLSPNRPFQTWIDGYGYSADEFFPVGNEGNATGAAVGHDIWGPSSPYFDGDLMEQILTAERSGQSMPIYYAGNSRVDRTFAPAQDWSAAGITTLVLYFNGDRANDAGTLYVTLNNKRVDYPNAAALSTGIWTQWNIDLASLGMALNSINKMSIGMDSTGSGLLYVDQISLYRDAPEVPATVDPGTTGLVAQYSFENDYTDASGHGLTGTPMGTPQFENGLAGNGSAVTLNGNDDFVDVPVGPLMNTLTDCTFALWTNFTGQGGAWQRIFDFGSGTTQYVFMSPSRGGDGALLFEMNGPNAGTNLVPAAMPLPTGWHHLAGVIDSTSMQMTLYMDGSVVGQGVTDSVPADMGVTTQNWLGKSQYTADPLYSGSIDEFRIYNRVLSEGEIRYLAGDR